MPRKPKTLRKIEYRVRGRFAFPTDMLRYDGGALPASREEARKMKNAEQSVRAPEPPHDIWLVLYLDPSWASEKHLRSVDACPCVGRWNSFSYQVVEIKKAVRVPLDQVPQSVLEKRGYV